MWKIKRLEQKSDFKMEQWYNMFQNPQTTIIQCFRNKLDFIFYQSLEATQSVLHTGFAHPDSSNSNHWSMCDSDFLAQLPYQSLYTSRSRT